MNMTFMNRLKTYAYKINQSDDEPCGTVRETDRPGKNEGKTKDKNKGQKQRTKNEGQKQRTKKTKDKKTKDKKNNG